MQLHIAGNFFISVERETRQAGGCGIPRLWLSVKKQVSGQVHILNNTPLILAFFDGTEEDINWYNPNNPTKILHATDLVEVLVLREFKDDNFLSIVKLVRFCAYNLKRAKTDSSKESRAEVLKCLYEDIELRKLIALYVLKTSEDKVMKPKALQQLLEYNITSKMLNINLNTLSKDFQEIDDDKKNINTKKNDDTTLQKNNLDIHHLSEQIPLENLSVPNHSIVTEKDIYNRIKNFDPSLLSFDEACDLLRNKSKVKKSNLVKVFTDTLALHNKSSDDQLRAAIPKLKKFLKS